MRKNDILQPDLKESTIHGDVLSPYNFYHCVIPDTFQVLLAHWHEEAEIGIIRSGKCIYHIASTVHSMETGDLIFLSPNTIHSISEVKGCSMVSDTLVFHLNLLGCNIPDHCSLKYFIPISQNAYSLTPVIHPHDHGYPQIKETLLSVLELFTANENKTISGAELLLKERLFHLFYLLYEYHYVITDILTVSPEIGDEKIKHVLTYMEDHFREPLRISTLAALCNFSEVHFMTLFKKTIGTSCIEYLNLYRLNRAAALLITTDDSVLNIAFDCGFTNISYFNRQFRSKYQMTPLEYRKKQNSV